MVRKEGPSVGCSEGLLTRLLRGCAAPVGSSESEERIWKEGEKMFKMVVVVVVVVIVIIVILVITINVYNNKITHNM